MTRASDKRNEEHKNIYPLSLWSNRDYLLLWGGQSVSAIGSQLTQFAYPLLILSLTNSPFLTGVISGLRSLPYLLFSPLAGALIDRWNRKRLMIFCDVCRSLCLISIPLALVLGKVTVAQIAIVAVLEGTFFVFFNIAEVASLPHVVPKEHLTTAVAQNETTMNLSYMLGPLLGGLLFGIGRLLPFCFDALSYVISTLSLLFIKRTFQDRQQHTSLHLWKDIQEGITWLAQHPLIRFMAVLCAIGNFLDFGTVILVVVIATRYHASSFAIGVIYTIAGAGGILGALVANPIQRYLGRGRTLILAQWVWVLLLPLYVVISNVIALGILTALTYILGSIVNVVQYSYRLTLIPEKLQGRVNSIFRLIAFVGAPLGTSITGTLLQVVGVTPTVLILTALLAFIAVPATLNTQLRGA